MRRRTFVGLGLSTLAVAGCAATPEQQVAALSPTGGAVDARARQSRRFDTADRGAMLQAVLGALQDLGFGIDESNADAGIVVGSKTAGARIRAQVSVRSIPDQTQTVIRATFQRYQPRPGAMLSVGETLDDPLIYQGFFERVAQSAFLTAHEI